jgi:hypothetical protein
MAKDKKPGTGHKSSSFRLSGRRRYIGTLQYNFESLHLAGHSGGWSPDGQSGLANRRFHIVTTGLARMYPWHAGDRNLGVLAASVTSDQGWGGERKS